MLTTVYFIRHAEPNYENHDDQTRELTAKGLADRKLVTDFLLDKNVTVALSSPYERAVATIEAFTTQVGLDIEVVADFRERKISDIWIADFGGFTEKQWADFEYKEGNGESLGEVQKRNIAALEITLEKHQGQTMIVGSHGTALSTIINYYDQTFGVADFEVLRPKMPHIVKFIFDGKNCQEIEQIDVFERAK